MPSLIFDCDGVLADTERYGHLPAFNQTFEAFGLPWRWSEEEYGRKLRIGGGKERMASMLTPETIRAAGLPDDPDALASEVAKWHQHKTALYTQMVADGKIQARPGIRRLISAAQDAGWVLAVASTSAEPSVRPSEVLVIEDSRIGLLAATGAGLRCLVTVNGYTEEEDSSEAILVVSSLGDPGGERTRVIANCSRATPDSYVTLEDLEAVLAS